MKVWLAVVTAVQVGMAVLLLVVVSDYHIGVSWSLFREALGSQAIDSIHLASQLGRLDLISLILALVGILLAFAFIGWMSLLRTEAKATVREIAETEAQSRLGEFISNDAAGIIQGYLDLINGKPEDADELARLSGSDDK